MHPGFIGQSVLALASAIVLGALVSEDGATIAAATLAASSMLDARLAFFSAFAGLWVGDLGIYALARQTAPAIRQHPWFKGWFAKSAAKRSSYYQNAKHLSLALSRFVPGTRLPAYIAAGIDRMPLLIFALTTAISALVWVFLVFAGIRVAPSHGVAARHQLALLSLFGLGLYALLKVWQHWNQEIRRAVRPWVHRMVKWEFWPAWLFYSPVALFCTFLGIRYRGFSLPTIANLNQKNGGIVGESKIGILRTLMESSPEFTADGYLIAPGTPSERMTKIREVCHQNEIAFPLVLKPDTAQRGAGFRKIQSFDEAERYVEMVSAPILLQRYIAGPKEAGIFYYRLPGEQRGHIFGITRKRFPAVRGDGAQTLRELILADPRARLLARTYLERFEAQADRVLETGETARLVEAGNHCQGCVFDDGSDLYTEGFRQRFDEISRKLPGFYIGRYDVRYNDDDELRRGSGFKIIELNGAASEATNIYDASNSLWSAYRTLYQQWDLVYRIGAANRERGNRPTSVCAVLSDWMDFSRQAIEYPIAD
jgi:membrane protein DedA with SNARE-associated domain